MTDDGSSPDVGVRWVRLPAVVDTANAADVLAELSGLLESDVAVLVADMAATMSLSLEGLQTMLRLRVLAKRRGAELRLAALQPQVRRYLALTGTDGLFSLYSSLDDSRAPARQPPPEARRPGG